MTTGRRRGHGEGGIHKRRDGRWEARLDWDMDGRVKRRSIYGRTRKEVADKLRQKQSERDASTVIYDERLTVGAFLDHWVNTILPHRVANGTLSNSTFYSYADSVRLHLKPALGHLRLRELRAAHIDKLIAARRGAYSANTLRIMRTTLRKALRDGYKSQLVPLSARDAIDLSEPVEVNKRARLFLDRDESRVLLEQISGDRLKALYFVLLSMGLRRGEALGLYWSDINVESQTLTIQRSLKRIRVMPLPNGLFPQGPRTRLELSSPKTDRSWRTQNLPQPVLDALTRHRARQATERLAASAWDNEDLVFTTPLGTPIDPSNLAKEFMRHAELAGLGHRNLHQLRHSAATIMLDQGIPLEDVSDILGHTTLSVTSHIYGHLSVKRRREAADAMDRALWG